jgi:hypothetical protein
VGYPFGKNITYWFQPLVDNEVPSTLLTVQTPAIYVFDTQPTRNQAAAGTGAVVTISSWAWDAERQSFHFTIPAIDDPDPTGSAGVEDYYIAINFRLQATEQIQTVLKPLTLERVLSQDRPLNVTQNDLRDHYPHIDSYSTDTQRERYIAQAILHVKNKLDRAGYKWARVNRPDELKLAVTLKALSMLLFVASQENGDKHWVKHEALEREFALVFEGIKLGYDSDGDGLPDTTTAGGGTLIMLR